MFERMESIENDDDTSTRKHTVGETAFQDSPLDKTKHFNSQPQSSPNSNSINEHVASAEAGYHSSSREQSISDNIIQRKKALDLHNVKSRIGTDLKNSQKKDFEEINPNESSLSAVAEMAFSPVVAQGALFQNEKNVADTHGISAESDNVIDDLLKKYICGNVTLSENGVVHKQKNIFFDETLICLDSTLLGSLSTVSRNLECGLNKTHSTIDPSIMRAGYSALQLEDLEETTRRWYMNTIKAQDHKPPVTTSPPKKPPPTFFPLKFNEGSLSTISKWACRNRSSDSGCSPDPYNHGKGRSRSALQKEADDSRSNSTANIGRKSVSCKVTKRMIMQPTVDARFRKCHICKLWGHYELECSRLPNRDVIRFGSALDAQNKRTDSKILHTLGNAADNPEHQNSIFKSKEVLEYSKSNSQDLQADHSVVLESFMGFMIEQRTIPENNLDRTPQKLNETPPIPLDYDASFLVDGFQIRASSSQKGLTEGILHSSNGPAAGGNKKRKTECGCDKLSEDTFKKTLQPFPQNSRFRVGDIVAWFPECNSDGKEAEKTDIYCGTISHVPKDIEVTELDVSEKRILFVEFLMSIPPSSQAGQILSTKGTSAVSTSVTRSVDASTIILPRKSNHGLDNNYLSPVDSQFNLPPAGSVVGVPHDRVFLVGEKCSTVTPAKRRKYKVKQERNGEAWKTEVEKPDKRLRGKIGHEENTEMSRDDARSLEPGGTSPEKKKPKINGGIRSRPRSMSYSQRFKQTGRLLSTDMSLAPRKPARKLDDGSYAMPQGRRPVGLEWDPIRGLWSLPSKNASKAKLKTKKVKGIK